MWRDRLQLLRGTNAALLVFDAAGLLFAAVGLVGAVLLAVSGDWPLALTCFAISLASGIRSGVGWRRERDLRRALSGRREAKGSHLVA